MWKIKLTLILAVLQVTAIRTTYSMESGRNDPIATSGRDERSALAVGSQLSTLKGMVSHPLQSSLTRGGILENPNAVNFTVIVLSVFLIVTAVISGTAGIMMTLHKLSVEKKLLDWSGSSPIDTLFAQLSESDYKHPGCTRIVLSVGKESKDIDVIRSKVDKLCSLYE